MMALGSGELSKGSWHRKVMTCSPPPAHVPQLRAPPEVLEADASGITRQGVKGKKDGRA